MRIRPRLGVSLLLLCAGCATYPVNRPLAQYKPDYGYRFSHYFPRLQDDETFVILTFSGGGTRAASLAYGVLRELDRTPVGNGKSLLDEVDLISGVSGGTFTAMYYALHGKEGLPDFEKDFLRKDVQGILKRSIWKPRNLVRLLSSYYSRADLAAEIYDQEVFHGATFADVAARNRRPFVIVNASEIDIGARFEFTQEEFDRFCSDLGSFPVARALTASSAVPVLLTPIRMVSYAGQCGYKEPEWIEPALKKYASDPLEYREAWERRAFLHPERNALHLMDGGISDNLGLRTAIRAMTSGHGDFSLLDLMKQEKIRRIVVIAVNAGRESDVKLGIEDRITGLGTVMRKVTVNQMTQHSFDSLGLLQKVAEDVPGVPVYIIHVDLYEVDDPAEKAIIHNIPTAFTLTKEQVDYLIGLGPRMLRASEQYQALVRDLTQSRTSEAVHP
jgi:NTE family protein